MIGLVLLFLLGCYINPSLCDYHNNINAIQQAEDLFELTHSLFQNFNYYYGLINLESLSRMFKTDTNILQSLTSSETVVRVITLLSAQASDSLLQTRTCFTGGSPLYFSWSSTPSACFLPPWPGAQSEEATSRGTLRSETLSTTVFSAKSLP